MAVLSGLGHRDTHPGRWIYLPFRDHRPYQTRSNKLPTTLVAPGRMIDNFLPISDAESLHLYSMVLKLACVCVHVHFAHMEMGYIRTITYGGGDEYEL